MVTLMRQGDFFAHPVEQPGAQLLLQAFDLYGDGGLGIAQFLGRFGKTLKLGYLDRKSVV